MQVTIASMEHMPGLQIVVATDAIDLGQHVCQAAARHSNINRVISGREASDGSCRALAGYPDLVTLFFVASEAHIGTAMQFQDLYNLCHLSIKAARITIDLDNQYRPGIQW